MVQFNETSLTSSDFKTTESMIRKEGTVSEKPEETYNPKMANSTLLLPLETEKNLQKYTSCTVNLHRLSGLDEIKDCQKCITKKKPTAEASIPAQTDVVPAIAKQETPPEIKAEVKTESLQELLMPLPELKNGSAAEDVPTVEPKSRKNRVRKFQCEKCKKSFFTYFHLRQHLRVHTGEKPFQCSECLKSFSQSTILNQHMRIHTGEKPYQCDQCEKAFKQLCHLKNHQLTHSNDKPHQCVRCKKSFTQLGHKRKHLCFYSGDGFNNCYSCEKSFEDYEEFKKHLQENHHLDYDKKICCNVCGKIFFNKATLTKHVKTHEDLKLHYCEKCKKSFVNEELLKKHFDSHNVTPDKKFQCDICYKFYSTSTSMKKHKRLHRIERPHRCDKCKKSFERLYDLEIHLLTRIHIKNKSNQDRINGSSVVATKAEENDEVVYECDKCDKWFTQKRKMRWHVYTHVDDRPFRCDECNKTFTNIYYLQHHSCLFNGEKLHKCHVCKLKFKFSEELSNHLNFHETCKKEEHECCDERNEELVSFLNHFLFVFQENFHL